MEDQSSIFITADTLWAEISENRNLCVLDASIGRPGDDSPGSSTQYAAGHIPGARFFDIEQTSDHDAPWPHMLPSAAGFAAAMQMLGISEDDAIVIYGQQSTTMGPARLWWMLRVFGHRGKVRILDGGLGAWRAHEYEIETKTPPEPRPPSSPYQARLNPALIACRAQVEAALRQQDGLIVDARPAARFSGNAPEPRPGLNSGHIPGSVNLPASTFLDERGLMLPRPACESLLSGAGIDSRKPVIATCGSGVTACMIALAACYCDLGDVRVYDASWCEWGDPSNDLPYQK